MKNKLVVLLMLIMWSIVGYAAELKDPTKPPEEEAPRESVETETLRLTFIKLDQGGNHSVVINGEVRILGEWYADAQIVKVGPNAVVLKGPKGDMINLKLWKTSVTKKPGGSAGDAVFPDVKSNRTGTMEAQ